MEETSTTMQRPRGRGDRNPVGARWWEAGAMVTWWLWIGLGLLVVALAAAAGVVARRRTQGAEPEYRAQRVGGHADDAPRSGNGHARRTPEGTPDLDAAGRLAGQRTGREDLSAHRH